MAGLVGRLAVSVLGDRQSAADAVLEYGFDGAAHRRGGLAGSDDEDAAVAAQVVGQRGRGRVGGGVAALAKATELGYNTILLSTFVEGEASEVAKMLVGLGREVQASGQPVPPPACLILGGETTVSLGDNPGQGGRNQEIALAAALALQHLPGLTVVSLATDGTDGPTDSAGGISNSSTVARGERAGLSAADNLRRHDAYPFLRTTADLLLTGPTQTNVNDLIFVFVQKM